MQTYLKMIIKFLRGRNITKGIHRRPRDIQELYGMETKEGISIFFSFNFVFYVRVLPA